MRTKGGKERLPRGLACLQTDETIYVGNKPFISLEYKGEKCFESKNAQVHPPKKEVKLKGASVRCLNIYYHFSEQSYQ